MVVRVMGASFQEVWSNVQHDVRPGSIIKNWGRARGYTGRAFRVEHIDSSGAIVFGGDMTVPRTVARGDFEKVYEVWEEYLAGERSRAHLTALSQNTTYILSILHLVLNAVD